MDFKAIQSLMKEMNQTELTVVEIEAEGIRIRMEKGGNIPMTVMQPLQIPAANISAPVVTAPQASPQATIVEESPVKKPEEVIGNKVLSPMVGTFYAKASPDKPPFVKVGDKVKKGQTLCIIEAMKLMNEIESEYDGEVAEVLLQNEDMVEYGQPLFIIK
ncbi:MAG: hypothetical protein K0S47_2536 [Herbinix sp.]|jgi:acetyl-CoA carboxylase biotin carboxyl carrier protein|nr:hypothetical protein [Herbinix sp.]